MRYQLPLLAILLLFGCQNEDAALREQVNILQAELTATQAKLAEAEVDPTGFLHAVYFWYKDGVSEERKAAFKKSLDELATVPSLETVYYGRSAVSERDVVDDSYDLAWICTFKDSSAQEAYQIDPIHLKFVEENKDLWERVQVYDSYASLDK